MTTVDLASTVHEVHAKLAGVTSEKTMHGECRVSALCCLRSGATSYEVGTEAYEFVKDTGDWLVSSCTLTIHRKDPWGPRSSGIPGSR